MDEDTDALDLLQREVYPLKLDYIGVVCRSQKDINDKKPISDAILDEDKFFKTHPLYRKISRNLALKALSSKLNALLIRHINKTPTTLETKLQA